VPAVICGLVALSERPAGRVRKAALAGVVTGVVGVAGFLLWIVLAVFGI
jgi:hypothetical protein